MMIRHPKKEIRMDLSSTVLPGIHGTHRGLPILAAAFLLASVGQGWTAEVTVRIENFTFAPAIVTVPTGTTITWVNDDDIPHLVVQEGGFRSKALDTGDKFSHLFAGAGSIDYYCALHPHMTGKVVVTP